MTGLKIILITFFLTHSVCLADYYSASLHKANWKLDKGSSFCQLKQDITLYGAADFLHQSGGQLRFSIREMRFKPEVVKASLTIDTSPWIHKSVPINDFLVYLDSAVDIQNYPRLSVYGETAETMLDALSKGLFPTFTYVRGSISGLLPETKVAVSAVNFLKQYDQFVDCRKDFLPFGLKQVLEKSLFFNLESNDLTPMVVKQITDTAKYIKEVEK